MKNTLFTLFAILFISISGQAPVSIWATDVNVRTCAKTSCELVGKIPNPVTATGDCQGKGETVTAEGVTNNYWTKLSGNVPNGFVSNIYITGDYVLGGVPLCGMDPTPVSTWGTNVNVRSCRKGSCEAVGKIAGPTSVGAICQDKGETVTAEGITNAYWTNIAKSGDTPGGWISNIYIKGEAVIKGVPMCTSAGDNGSPPPHGGSTSLTQEDLQEMMPNADASNVQAYFPHLNAAMAEGQVNTCPRMSAFLAQLAQESGELQFMEELASGEEYEGRCSDLGNCSPGDGVKYKGRGPIQLTGKANYERAGADLGLDLVNNPKLAAQPENAFRIAVWFWNGRDLNALADQNTQESFNQITLKINGCIDCSSTHNDVRTDYWKKNKAILGC